MHEVDNVQAEVGGKLTWSGCGPNLTAQPAFSMVNQRTAHNGLAEEGVLPCARGSGQNVWKGRSQFVGAPHWPHFQAYYSIGGPASGLWSDGD